MNASTTRCLSGTARIEPRVFPANCLTTPSTAVRRTTSDAAVKVDVAPLERDPLLGPQPRPGRDGGDTRAEFLVDRLDLPPTLERVKLPPLRRRVLLDRRGVVPLALASMDGRGEHLAPDGEHLVAVRLRQLGTRAPRFRSW
jgi:hypothetical protein